MNPEPAKPEEAAIFCRLGGVPDGWEVRNPEDASQWHADSLLGYFDARAVVEARPPKPKTVMVEVPQWLAELWVGPGTLSTYASSDGATFDLADAARKALEQ